MSQLREMSMLGGLSIGMMGTRKFDKKETQELAKTHGTDASVLRITKKLFTSADCYKAIAAAAQDSRLTWYANTLPWDDGKRIFTSDIFMTLSQKMLDHEKKFTASLHPFYEQYPFLKSRDKGILNGLYRDDDYPDLDKVKRKFYFEINYEPIPEASDFRVDLRDEDVKAIQENIREGVERRVRRAMEEPYARLFDGVAHMAARLSGAKNCLCRKCKDKEFQSDQFGDSVVTNLVELCDVLPKLNLTGDQTLNDLVAEVKAALTGFEPDTVRENEGIRGTLAERAMELQKTMSAFYQAA